MSSNEWILIIMVVIASLVFCIVPAVLVIVLVPAASGYGWVILLPIPMIIFAIIAYIVWKVKEHSNAQRNVELMNAAAQPVTPESRSVDQGTSQQASQIGDLPTPLFIERKKITAVTTVSHQDGGANEMPQKGEGREF